VPLLNEDTTKSVVLNTFHYQNYFEQEFLNVGKKPFTGLGGKVVDAEAVEVIGSFPVYETPEFYAVAFPLESDGIDKHAVFVLPKTGVKEYLNSPAVETVFKAPPKFWVYKTIRVQVPKINITLAHNVEQYITPEVRIYWEMDMALRSLPAIRSTTKRSTRHKVGAKKQWILNFLYNYNNLLRYPFRM
jgi:serine protease inhibitor